MELKGLTINFLGDSITEGVGASSPDALFHAVLKRNAGLKEVRERFVPDGLYPNDAGHTVIAHKLQMFLQNL